MSIIPVCWETVLPSHIGVTYIRWSAYIRANVLLLCLSEAIWQVERGVIVYLKSVSTQHVWGSHCLLRQKYHLRYLFYCVLWAFAYFSVILVHFSLVKLDFDFPCALFSYCKTIWKLPYYLVNTMFIWF